MCMQETDSSVLVKILSLFLISAVLNGSAAARSLTWAVAWQLSPKHIEKHNLGLFSPGITLGAKQPCLKIFYYKKTKKKPKTEYYSKFIGNTRFNKHDVQSNEHETYLTLL